MMEYYDLPRSQIMVSEEEALFDRLFDDDQSRAFWYLAASKIFGPQESLRMLKTARHPTRGLKGLRLSAAA